MMEEGIMDHGLTETAATPPSWLARLAGAVSGAAAEIRAALSRTAMNRRVLQRLSTLSARELKDIGLTPQDMADACLPGTGDAIDLLVNRRDERRHARMAQRW
jgi:uncharacterized protein YjiS (DUF1127 family)